MPVVLGFQRPCVGPVMMSSQRRQRQPRKKSTKAVIDERIARLTAARKRMEDKNGDRLGDRLSMIAAACDELGREDAELVTSIVNAFTGHDSAADDEVKAPDNIDVQFYYTDDDD